MYDAIILAGGKSPWLKPIAGTDCRAAALIAGKPMLNYINQALVGSAKIERVVVIAPKGAVEGVALEKNTYLVDAGNDLLETLELALAKVNQTRPVVIVTDDIPLLTTEAVDDFLRQAERSPADFLYTIIPQVVCQRDFPQGQRTYGRLKDGCFTGGNMFLVKGPVVMQQKKKAEEIFAKRKSPWQLCSWLGWWFVCKLLLHRLTLAEVEARASLLLGFSGRAIITNYSGVGMDVDKKSDWELIAAVLAHNSARCNEGVFDERRGV